MIYIKNIVWTLLIVAWLFITYDLGEGASLMPLYLAIAAVLTSIWFIVYHKWTGKKPKEWLSSSNSALVLIILGLENIIGGDTLEYLFIVIVAVVGIAFDIYDRYLDEKNGIHK